MRKTILFLLLSVPVFAQTGSSPARQQDDQPDRTAKPKSGKKKTAVKQNPSAPNAKPVEPHTPTVPSSPRTPVAPDDPTKPADPTKPTTTPPPPK
jgi:hypothetical protein